MEWLWEIWDRVRYGAADLKEWLPNNWRLLFAPTLLLMGLIWWFYDPPNQVGESPEDARLVVVLIHGHGASKTDLEPLADLLLESSPDNSFVMPEAPHRIGMGYTWYPSFSVPTQAEVAIRQNEHRAQARAVIMEIVRELLADGVRVENLYLGGFSQGATVALDTFMSEPELTGLGGVIFMSGGALDIDLSPLAERAPGRVLISHGTSDSVLGSGRARQLEAALNEGGHQVQYVEFDGGHRIALPVQAALSTFLSSSSGERPVPAP